MYRPHNASMADPVIHDVITLDLFHLHLAELTNTIVTFDAKIAAGRFKSQANDNKILSAWRRVTWSCPNLAAFSEFMTIWIYSIQWFAKPCGRGYGVVGNNLVSQNLKTFTCVISKQAILDIVHKKGKDGCLWHKLTAMSNTHTLHLNATDYVYSYIIVITFVCGISFHCQSQGDPPPPPHTHTHTNSLVSARY